MADLKISELNALAGASLASGDELAIVDTSASETKKITSTDLVRYGYGLISSNTLDGDVIEPGTTSARGTVQLNDSTSSTSTTTAATANAVKASYDLANAALPKAGGTMTGQILADDSTSPGTPGYAFDGDPNTGLVRTGADELALVTNGTARLTADASGNVVISGNLTVQGTTTTIDSTTLIVEDKNVVIGNVTSPTDVTADGGGITLKSTVDKTIQWIDSTDAWTFSEHVNIASGKEYRIAGTKVLDATSLGSGVVSSSLTSVGTIATGTWQGSAIASGYGGTGQTTYTDGQLLIGKTDGTLAKSTLTAGNGIDITNGDGSVSVDVDLKANGGLVIESTELAVDLGATSITGTLATGDGGTGQTTYSNGQLLIGKSDGTLAKATLTASTGVTITNGDGAITISSVGLGGTVTDVTATSPIASTGGTAPIISIQDASTSQKGAVQLEDSTSSTSTTKAATPNSVKSAYDLANAALPKAGGTVTGDVTFNAQSDLRFADSDSSNWVALQAPATVASNVTWTLPNADGTANQFLKTDGSGALGWGAAGGATLNEFTSSGTWTKPSGANFVMVEVWGAGGGGGSGTSTASPRIGGTGGGGGAYNYRVFKASAVGATETVTIGSGGTGGASVSGNAFGNNGSNGGDTTFGSVLKAFGGGGGRGGLQTGVQEGGAGGGTLSAANGFSSAGAPLSRAFGGGTTTSGDTASTGPSGFGGGAGGGKASGFATSNPGAGSSSGGCGGGCGGSATISGGVPLTAFPGEGGSQNQATGGGGAADTAGVGFQGGGGGNGFGGAGGAGGTASGGGGGGGVLSPGNSGAGGAGGAGLCRVYTW